MSRDRRDDVARDPNRLELHHGQRRVITLDVDRYPHFIAKAGLTGTAIRIEPLNPDDPVPGWNLVLDEQLDGAEEWHYEVQFTCAQELCEHTQPLIGISGEVMTAAQAASIKEMFSLYSAKGVEPNFEFVVRSEVREGFVWFTCAGRTSLRCFGVDSPVVVVRGEAQGFIPVQWRFRP